MDDLCKRLRAQGRGVDSRGLTTWPLINPDGPEAANELDLLINRVKVLEGALAPFARAADRLRADDADSMKPAYATAADYRRARQALGETGNVSGREER